MYKPLPNNLTISTSKIHDCGIFAKENIPEQTDLGMTHVELGKLILRTPLGGFLNHSDTPNCTKSRYFMTNTDDVKIKHDYTRYDLVALEDIAGGEELTTKYTFYNIK